MVENHHRIVYGIALRILGDARRAEDVTESVFADLWRSGRLGEPATAGAWLVLNTRRLSIDIIRNESAPVPDHFRAATLEDGFLSAPSDAAPVPRETASKALHALSPDERSVVELGFFDGRSYREIALETGLDPALVMTYIRSALDGLREAAGRR